MITIEGQRVSLRALERAHCRQLWEAYEPEEPVPGEPLRPGLSLEGADRWFEEIQADQGKGRLHLGIFSPDGRLLGDAQLTNIDWGARSASLGVGIARRKDRGYGFGTEAARALINHAFSDMDLVRISAATAEHNKRAQKSLEKLGMVIEGRQRLAIYSAGRRWDRLLYGLLRDEWASLASAH